MPSNENYNVMRDEIAILNSSDYLFFFTEKYFNVRTYTSIQILYTIIVKKAVAS